MSVVIRKMSQADSHLWAEMRFSLWNCLAVNEHLSDIEKMLRGSKRVGYIALLPDQASGGFAEICIREYANGCTAQPVPFLEGIWVNPRHRRNGIGRLLIEKITGDLLEQGFLELCSDAEIGNRRSHKAHAKWGFSETDRVVYFRKPLK